MENQKKKYDKRRVIIAIVMAVLTILDVVFITLYFTNKNNDDKYYNTYTYDFTSEVITSETSLTHEGELVLEKTTDEGHLLSLTFSTPDETFSIGSYDPNTYIFGVHGNPSNDVDILFVVKNANVEKVTWLIYLSDSSGTYKTTIGNNNASTSKSEDGFKLEYTSNESIYISGVVIKYFVEK